MVAKFDDARIVGHARWVIPLVLHVSLFIAFIDRINLSIALPKVGESFGWTDRDIAGKGSLLLGAFYVSYALSNLLFSGIASSFGPRRSLLAAVICFSAFTALGAPLSFSLPLFLGTRILLGIGEGVHFPMMNMLMKAWFPMHERSRANAIWIFGAQCAAITAPWFLVPVVATLGWRAMLVGCGVLGGLITIPLLVLFVFDSPRASPHVSDAEAAYIESHLSVEPDGAADWSFVGRPMFWIAVLGAVLNNYCVYGIVNWLPTYFVVARNLDFSHITYAASLPYVGGLLGFTVYAYLGDRSNRRIAMCAAGFAGAALSLYLATQATSLSATIFAFTVATFCQTAYISQEFPILQKVLPASVMGRAAGVYNGCSVLFGAVGGTVLLGQIVEQTGSYDYGLYSIVAATILGSMVMMALSRYVQC